MCLFQAITCTYHWVVTQFWFWGVASTSASPHTSWLWRSWCCGTQRTCWDPQEGSDMGEGTNLHRTGPRKKYIIFIVHTLKSMLSNRKNMLFLVIQNSLSVKQNIYLECLCLLTSKVTLYCMCECNASYWVVCVHFNGKQLPYQIRNQLCSPTVRHWKYLFFFIPLLFIERK